MPSCYLVSPSSKPGQELGAPAPRELQRLATRATMFSPGGENIYIYIIWHKNEEKKAWQAYAPSMLMLKLLKFTWGTEE